MTPNLVDLPCSVEWCVALTESRFCVVHQKSQHIHPQELTPENKPPAEGHWPVTPWDDDHPWDKWIP
jgi:hypothetical protein